MRIHNKKRAAAKHAPKVSVVLDDNRIAYSMRAVAQLLGMSERSVWSLVKNGQLRAAKFGHLVRIAKKNYLLVRDEDFAKAIEQCSTDCGTVTSRNEQQLNEESLGNPREKGVFPDKSKAFLMEVKGLEPMTSCMPCHFFNH
jgi:excisionase family DNA binding protein